MIFRDHRMIIPHGDDCLFPRDNAYFIGDPKAIEKFSKNFVPSDTKMVERVIIIGAGRTGRFLAPMLDKEGIKVKIFDKDRERCRQAAELLDNGLAIYGDGTDIDLLEQEGIADADVVICLTDDDRLNLMLALIAKHLAPRRPSFAYRASNTATSWKKSASTSSCRRASCRPVKSWPLPAAAASSLFPSWKGPRPKRWKSSYRTGLP